MLDDSFAVQCRVVIGRHTDEKVPLCATWTTPTLDPTWPCSQRCAPEPTRVIGIMGIARSATCTPCYSLDTCFGCCLAPSLAVLVAPLY
ncbi:hypothetical protein PAXRUDRAFT_584083 [Paxillus rubicundulus Ve08.2h10]|uniref:Uncharacterized protein n=1 Tax=Paxillus rubicundulus Ve08.2h10 TaxID=930991 RepID=A0A0D0DU11_9AGAM|nr:hypothetical protein PAXRUDRAFT_584083 [Paxillus rubicundulus Ve08.2h10]